MALAAAFFAAVVAAFEEKPAGLPAGFRVLAIRHASLQW